MANIDNEILIMRASPVATVGVDARDLPPIDAGTDRVGAREAHASIWTRPILSCLMATYANERPERLARALESIFRQTMTPDEMVLVLDGPVPPEQEQVIARYARDARVATMLIVRLAENQGLGAALNAGLDRCRGEWNPTDGQR